ncbi:MAG: class I SAM-dependent methyltransferase [Woeseiaceae bacterium]
MERIPEEELMNNDESAKAYAYADFASPHDLFVQLFKEKFSDIPTSLNDTVLDLGCGPCDITRRLAQAFPSAGFHGVDGAVKMLKYAHALNEAADLSPRIRLIEGCLPQVELPQDQYHVIVSNSLLHHLHDPSVLWGTIKKHAKPYGYVFIMDLLRPIDEPTVDFLVNEYAADEEEILKKDFINSLRAAFTVKEVQKQLHEINLTNLKVEEVTDRHMIIYGVM